MHPPVLPPGLLLPSGRPTRALASCLPLAGLLLVLTGPQAARAQTFAAATTYSTGANTTPRTIAVADVNGDGRIDLLTANSSGNAAGVLLGNGNGTFQAVAAYSTGSGSLPYDIAVADVNGDGRPDLLTANYLGNAASVLLGNGNGTFQTALTYSTGTGSKPTAIAVADVNGDGRIDLLTANSSGNAAGVLLGNGNGTFQAVAAYSAGTGSNPNGIAVADVNGDGKLDLLTANSSGNTAGILLGNGNGTFQAVVTYGAGGSPAGIAVADVNSDGKLDLITANGGSQSVGVLLGNGNGTFQTVTATYASSSNAIAVADVNGDNKLDLITAISGPGQAGVLLGNGNGTFQTLKTFSVGGGTSLNGIAVADVNGDGKPDVFTPNSLSNTAGVLLNTTVPVAAPTVSTGIPTNVASTGATLGGNVTNDGGASVSGRGVVYSTSSTTPAISTAGVTQAANGTGTGSFSAPVSGLNPGMLYYVRAYAINSAGTSYGSVQQFATPPSAPVVQNPTDGRLTNSNRPTYSGTGQVGSTVTVYVDGTSIGSTTVPGGGFWGLAQPVALADGPHTVWATAQINGSAASANSNTNSFTVDVTAPAAPVVLTPANGSLTADNTPTYTGTAEPNNSVNVYADGAYVGNTSSDAGGNWSFTQPTALPDGPHTVRALALDRAGNFSPNSNTNTYTVDTTRPTVQINSTATTPTSASPIPVSVTFSESVTGFAASDVVATNGTLNGFSGSGTTYAFSVTPAADGPVTVNVAAGVAQDAAGNDNTAATQFSITYAAAVSDLTVSTGTAASPTAIPAGTYNNVTITGTGAAILGGAVVVNGTLTVQAGGSLSTNCQSLSGSGSFALDAGATLLVCDAAGISSGGASGAVQLTGTRSFSADATYVYNGTTAQATGTGLPAQVRNLTISKPSGTTATLTQALAIRQVLSITGAGGLNTGGRALTLLSDASGTALLANLSTGQVAGNVTVQRYIDPSKNPGLGYRHIAAPAQSQTIASLGSGGTPPVLNPAYNSSTNPTMVTPFPSVFRYVEARLASSPATTLAAFDRGWVAPSTTGESMPLTLGYTVQLPGASTLSFTGSLVQVQGAISMFRASGATAADAGWNLVGNPYASPLDFSTVQAGQRINVDAAYYVFESTSQYGGQYRSYVNGFGNPVIGTAQAFFVRVNSGQTSGSITFNNSNRLTDYNTPAPVRRGPDLRPQLTLQLGGQGLTDALTVYTEAGATDAADAEFDAVKLPNSSGLNLGSVAGSGQEMSIDGRAAFGPATLIPLTVQVPRAGAYVFRAEHVANLPTGLTLTLVDQHTGVRTPLTTGSTYTALFSGTTAPGRFVLEAGSRVTAGAAAQAAQQVQLYPNPTSGQLTLLRPTAWGATQVEVLNGVGQVMLRRALPAADTQLDVQALPAGVYHLRLTTPQGAVTKRLVRQ